MFTRFFTLKISGTTDDVQQIVNQFRIVCPHREHDRYEKKKRDGKVEIELYFSPCNKTLSAPEIKEILEFVAQGSSVRCLSCTLTNTLH